jgi:uncharacterized protein (TIGR04255 family)
MAIINTPFPHAERRDLADPPIELILAQVRFPTLADLYSNEGYVRFATEIRAQYPKAVPLHEVGIRPSSGIEREISLTPVWQFEDVAGDWSVTLTPEFLALELKRYKRFSDFRERLDSLWQKLVEMYSITNRTRLGLRYIDRFATDKRTTPPLPDGWFDLIESSVFPMKRLSDKLQPQAGQLVHSFAIQSNLSLTFRGAFKWGTPDDPAFREFVLDLDCYDASVGPTNDVASRLDDLKEVTHNAFWWTFGKLLITMEPAHASD